MTDKILRIDVHQHVVFDEYRSALESAGLAGSGERGWPDWSADESGVSAPTSTTAPTTMKAMIAINLTATAAS